MRIVLLSPYSSTTVVQAGASYTAVGGEGLQAVALNVWGDASLWYLLAEANGLEAGATLLAGQLLSLPNVASNVHNSSETFKPYNPLEAQGNTLPTLPKQPQPPAKQQGCGTIGQILVVIIAVVVTAVVAPYAIAAVTNLGAGATLGQAFTMGVVGTTASGAAIVSGGAMGAAIAAGTASIGIGAAIGGGAIAGAAGGLASQTFAVATGIQSKFDWAGVAMGAIAGGVVFSLET